MLDFIEKKEAYLKAKEDIEDHIWDVFHKYLRLTNQNFSDPDGWTIDSDSIRFSGKDGCLSCYDPMVLYIPLEWFVDFEKASKGKL